MRTMRLIVALSCCGAAHAFGPAIGAASVAGFLGWAFQGVGPSKDAAKVCRDAGPSKIRGLNRALLFGNGEPAVALYCGAKVRKASYAPLACAISEKLGGDGVLVLQSPLNVYAFKPATVEKVLDRYPSVRCVAGHSIGGLWAVEFCRDLVAAGKWPENGLSFYYMGVHGRGVSLEPFRGLPFDKVGWSCASARVGTKVHGAFEMRPESDPAVDLRAGDRGRDDAAVHRRRGLRHVGGDRGGVHRRGERAAP
mmetsp:Transcript_13649/g.42204  ORF Transcript_13649/g.42204 Transcript_13649/m.42204 type:complete len:252 (-) Transcript_13649:103-858(-)